VTTPRLAICIPAYNREAYIADTIKSVLEQADERIELCISDNGSTDNTVAIALATIRNFSATRISIAPKNLGADTNYLAAVALATAEFCLLLGSDDILAPGAIASLLDEIERHDPDILLFDRLTCTSTMEPLRIEHALRPATAADFPMSTKGTLETYLAKAESLCAAFSYISSVVFRKKEWDLAYNHSDWVGSAYVHSYKLLIRCCSGAHLRYLPEPLVFCRLGNDSFRDNGLCHRILIDLHGFSRLANLLEGHGDSVSATRIRSLMRKEYSFWRIVRYQSLLAADPAWHKVTKSLLEDFTTPKLWLYLAIGLGCTPGVGRASFILRDFHLKYLI
jgi:abequosyltransferase